MDKILLWSVGVILMTMALVLAYMFDKYLVGKNIDPRISRKHIMVILSSMFSAGLGFFILGFLI